MNTNQSSSLCVVRPMFGARRHKIITALVFAGLFLQSATAVAPNWWATRNVFAVGAVTDDYAVANVGQLKNMAKKAALEMRAEFTETGGAGTVIDGMITGWETAPAPGITRDDYAALTVGQLKQVASKFYDRLAALTIGSSAAYPWNGSGVAKDDYALVNVGQLKSVFAFGIGLDTDHDGMLDALEVQFFGNLNQNAAGDFDGDDLNNLAELQSGTLPNQMDTDGDGVMDGQEIALGTDPTLIGSSPVINLVVPTPVR